MKKENEQLQKDLKNANVNATGVELRLNRANEECEKAKNALKIAKQEEKVSMFNRLDLFSYYYNFRICARATVKKLPK